jgi:ketosteroid isomerase-like protein
MRRFMFVMILAAMALPILAARPSLAQSKDEQAIRALIDRTIQANNSVDEKVVKQAMGDLGSNAGPFYPPFAASAESAAALDPLVTRMLAALSARTFAVNGPMTVRVDKNLGWANYAWRADVTFKDGTKRSFDGRTTATFAREGKNWKYVHWHSSLAAPFPATSKELDAEAQTIINLERNAWEAYKNKQLEAFSDYYVENASSFGDDQAYRVKGRADILRELEAGMKQGEVLSYQILDPQVQVLGDAALLTYYYSETGTRDGKSYNHAGKITVVFVKQGGKWRALHEHIAQNQPPPRNR